MPVEGLRLDEHCDPAIAAGLRRHWVDITTSVEAGSLGAEEEAHIAHGLATGRVVFTQDEDSLRRNAAGMEQRG